MRENRNETENETHAAKRSYAHTRYATKKKRMERRRVELLTLHMLSARSTN